MHSGIKQLTFVVSTGRSGSTALSRVLRLHPEVLSLNELFASTMDTGNQCLSQQPLEGREFWQTITAPNPHFDAMVRSGVPIPEFLYNRHPEWRHSSWNGGIPAISMMMLPHLSADPDALSDALEPEVCGWPARPAARQWEAFFDALATRLGGREVAVERSGTSLGRVPVLRELFPGARFVHLHRDGPDCALSMSRHTGFRLLLLQQEILRRSGVTDHSELTAGHVAALPPHLAGLFGREWDPALVHGLEMPAEDFGALWSQMVCEGVGHLAAIPGRLRTQMSYEGLLDAPRQELARLAAFIGVQPLAEWLTAGSALLDSSRRGAAKQLTGGELTLLRERCAPGEQALNGGGAGLEGAGSAPVNSGAAGAD